MDQQSAIKVCFYIFFPSGGIGKYTNVLMEEIGRKSDIYVEAVCTPDYQWKDTAKYHVWSGLKTISHSISTFRRMGFLRGQFLNPLRCIDHAEEIGARIIHFANINHLSFPFWKGRLASSNIKVVASVHDVKRQKSILNRSWEDGQLRSFYRFADALFVHSEYQLRELVEFADIPEDKIYVVPHGPYSHGPAHIDGLQAKKKFGIPPDISTGLFFGQIRDEKNLDQLVRAVHLSDAPFHLVVAGQGGGKHRGIDYYRQYAASLGIEDRITFIPRYIAAEEVGDLFAACDWIALPYSRSFTSQSGVLNVATYYEKPVLVSSAPVLRETVDQCDIGVVCKGDSAGPLALGIKELLGRLDGGHPHRFEEYRQRFGWAANVAGTMGVYRDLVS